MEAAKGIRIYDSLELWKIHVALLLAVASATKSVHMPGGVELPHGYLPPFSSARYDLNCTAALGINLPISDQ